MTTILSRARLQTRHHVQGALVFDTALHLGGGRIPAKGTDSPIVRDGFGRPYIPGSSIKGAVRAAVERIVPNLNISACGLYDQEANCLSALPETDPLRKSYRDIQEAIGRKIKESEELAKAFSTLLKARGKTLSDLPDTDEVSEENLLFLLEFHLCDVCKAFGSPFISSAIFFHDAAVDPQQWVGITQVRDGVGIDRDSGRAVDGLKYDYEVVPAETAFRFSLTIETGDPVALGLAALALHELRGGNVPLGGIRSRGLGRCHLDHEKTEVESLDFSDLEVLKAYLSENKTSRLSLDEFINKHISNLWTTKEGSHV
ncbi:MAG: hypothetical protein HUU32_16930 [Calditrichaceae bacterium]|nr:RAMP superfamily CRISPR-associated protein [Calditrichia bacterium]NUQ43076.1 hypothetical protein [Calditrichaceae bacterium]